MPNSLEHVQDLQMHIIVLSYLGQTRKEISETLGVSQTVVDRVMESELSKELLARLHAASLEDAERLRARYRDLVKKSLPILEGFIQGVVETPTLDGDGFVKEPVPMELRLKAIKTAAELELGSSRLQQAQREQPFVNLTIEILQDIKSRARR
ncbi:MAG: hypothetical protein QXI02_04050 [Candidatus Caldarchaeum sp.]